MRTCAQPRIQAHGFFFFFDQKSDVYLLRARICASRQPQSSLIKSRGDETAPDAAAAAAADAVIKTLFDCSAVSTSSQEVGSLAKKRWGGRRYSKSLFCNLAPFRPSKGPFCLGRKSPHLSGRPTSLIFARYHQHGVSDTEQPAEASRNSRVRARG